MDNQPEVVNEMFAQVGPIMVGTAVAMWFQPGAWPRRIAQAVVGIPFGIYMAPLVDRLFDTVNWSITESEAGVLTGVFGITIVAYAYEVIHQLHLPELLRAWLWKKLGIHDHRSQKDSK